MTVVLSENIHSSRKKSILFAILALIASIVFYIILNYARAKPTKFLLPQDGEIQITYDPLKLVVAKNKPKTKKIEENNLEAEINLKAALELKNAGKFDKAFKVFQHSLSLAPNNPKVNVIYIYHFF
jgi:hypothetical protein